MPSPKTQPPLYPKSHIVVASGIAAALSIFLLVIPTSDVEARKTYAQLDLDIISADQVSRGTSKDLNALISETITFSLADELNKQPVPLAAKQSFRGRNYQALPVDLPMAIVVEVPAAPEWKNVTVNSGDTLSVVFERFGLPATTLHAVINSSSDAKRFTRLKAGQVLDFKLDEAGELAAIKSRINDLETLRLDREGDSYAFTRELITPDVRTQFAQGEITSSLFLAAQRAGMSHNLTMEMANIFGYDVDFARDIRQGDRFEVMYEELHVGDKRIGTNNILAARFSNRGKSFTAVRFTDKSGYSSYYRADGTSLRKAFIRTPVEFARISSKFNPNRRHPVLNKIRAHNGVDYAAATGTPIKATGDGRIIHVGRKGGYGNTIIVQHGQKYKTLYAHMSRYANNLRQGSNVSQGQIIGYVGMTGLATGPHLHYEFLVNGRHVNPLGIDLPVADPVPQNERTAFMAISNNMMASLDQKGDTQMAQLEQ